MENLVSLVSEDDDLDTDTLTNLALCLNVALSSQFEERVFPEEDSPK